MMMKINDDDDDDDDDNNNNNSNNNNNINNYSYRICPRLTAHSHFVRNEVCTKRSFYRTYVSNDVHISYRMIFVSYEGHSHFVRYEVRFCAVCVKIC